MAKVFDLANGVWIDSYTELSPRDSVIAAYAQRDHKDFNTWDYEKRYSNRVEESDTIYLLGDYSARKAK